MNLRLFQSLHAAAAAALVAAFWLWLELAGVAPGRGPGLDNAYLLWSGWTALALYLVLVLYAARKYAHKGRYTPEFRWKLPAGQLEQAQARLGELRVRVVSGELRTRPAIRRAARQILRREGVSKVLWVRIRKGPREGPRFLLEVEKRQPIGRVAKWMHAHIYYGLAAAVLVWLHGGGNFGSPMGFLLNGLSYLVIATGVAGIVLWTFGPTWLTRRERDLSLEKAFNLRQHYSRKVREVEEELRLAGAADPSGRVAQLAGRLQSLTPLAGEFKAGGAADFTGRARAVLEGLGVELPTELAGEEARVRDTLVLLGQRRNVEKEWRSLARIRFCMNVWRLVHVPASILLMAAVLFHVLSVWWY